MAITFLDEPKKSVPVPQRSRITFLDEAPSSAIEGQPTLNIKGPEPSWPVKIGRELKRGALPSIGSIPKIVAPLAELSERTGLTSGPSGIIPQIVSPQKPQIAPKLFELNKILRQKSAEIPESSFTQSALGQLTQAAGSLPSEVLKYGASTALLGPVAGFAVPGALEAYEPEAAPQENIMKMGGEALKGAALGKAFHYFGKLPRVKRMTATATLMGGMGAAGAPEGQRIKGGLVGAGTGALLATPKTRTDIRGTRFRALKEARKTPEGRALAREEFLRGRPVTPEAPLPIDIKGPESIPQAIAPSRDSLITQLYHLNDRKYQIETKGTGIKQTLSIDEVAELQAIENQEKIINAQLQEQIIRRESVSESPEFAKKYREVKVTASPAIFEKLGVKPANIFADYITIQKKHPEEFSSPEVAKNHVEYVLAKPSIAIPATQEGYTLLVRKNGGNKAAIVEFVLKGGKYRVRSAYTLDKGQLERKIEMLKQQLGSQFPEVLKEFQYPENLTQGAAVPSGTGSIASASEKVPQIKKERKSSLKKLSEEAGFARIGERPEEIKELHMGLPILHPEEIKAISDTLSNAKDDIHRLFAPYSVTDPAKLAAGELRSNLGRAAQSYDRAENALLKASNVFKRQSNEKNLDFIDRMEKGLPQKTTDLQRAADIIRGLLDSKREEIRGLGTGKLEHFIENYFPHIWEQIDKEGNINLGQRLFAKRPLAGSQAFLKQRVLEDTKTGIDLGLRPVSYNPVDLALTKIREMDKYLMAHRTLNALKEEGLVKIVPHGERPPEGFARINDKISFTPKGIYWAQRDATNIINNYLSPGFQKYTAYQLIRGAGNVLNQAQLSLSAFHLGFTSMDTTISKAALGLYELGKGRPIEAVSHILAAPFAPVVNYMKGNKLYNAWFKGEGSKLDLLMADLMASGGGRARMDQFYATKATDQMVHALRSGKIMTGIFKVPFVALEIAAKPIMEHIVPRQKLGIFSDAIKAEIERNPDITNKEMRAIAQKIWDSVDNRMGQLVYDNLFWNKALKDISMISVRSVGWNLGTIREVGGGVKDLKTSMINASKGKWDGISHRTSYLIALPAITALYGGIIHYLMTGKAPETLKDYFFPGPKGKKRSLPTYMKDIAAYGIHPIQTIFHKTNPLISLVQQMIDNKDFYGVQIRNEDDPAIDQMKQELTFILKEFRPFAFRPTPKGEKATSTERAEQFFGITRAPAYVQQTAAERKASEISGKKIPFGARTKKQFEKSNLKSALRKSLQAKEPSAILRLTEAVKEHKISNKEKRELLKTKGLTDLEYKVRRFTVEELQKVIEKANSEEKEILENILKKKVKHQKSRFD